VSAKIAAALLIALILAPFSAPFATYDLQKSAGTHRSSPAIHWSVSSVNLASSHVLLVRRLRGRATVLSAEQLQLETFGQPGNREVGGASRAIPRTLAAIFAPVPRL
jgi:hypothetical protein